MVERGGGPGLADKPEADLGSEQCLGPGSLSATGRFSSGSIARKTTPNPPRPSSRTITEPAE